MKGLDQWEKNFNSVEEANTDIEIVIIFNNTILVLIIYYFPVNFFVLSILGYEFGCAVFVSIFFF